MQQIRDAATANPAIRFNYVKCFDGLKQRLGSRAAAMQIGGVNIIHAEKFSFEYSQHCYNFIIPELNAPPFVESGIELTCEEAMAFFALDFLNEDLLPELKAEEGESEWGLVKRKCSFVVAQRSAFYKTHRGIIHKDLDIFMKEHCIQRSYSFEIRLCSDPVNCPFCKTTKITHCREEFPHFPTPTRFPLSTRDAHNNSKVKYRPIDDATIQQQAKNEPEQLPHRLDDREGVVVSKADYDTWYRHCEWSAYKNNVVSDQVHRMSCCKSVILFFVIIILFINWCK